MARASAVHGLQPADVAFIRFSVAGLILLPWLLSHQPLQLAGVGWRRGAILAALAGPAFIFIGVGGYHFAPLAHGAVFQPAALTLGGLALSAVMLGDKLTMRRILGAAVIVAGLAVVAGPSLFSGNATTRIGDAMFALAGLMWALFAALTRKWRIAPIAATAVVCVLSLAVFAPWFVLTQSFARLATLPMHDLMAQIIVQGVLSGVVAVLAFTRAVELLGPARAAVFPAIVPAVAILMGIPIAHESPTMLQGTGVGVVLLGLLVVLGLKPPRFAGLENR
jgi:drug/metabolite transporter (DMT)-like permease